MHYQYWKELNNIINNFLDFFLIYNILIGMKINKINVFDVGHTNSIGHISQLGVIGSLRGSAQARPQQPVLSIKGN